MHTADAEFTCRSCHHALVMYELIWGSKPSCDLGQQTLLQFEAANPPVNVTATVTLQCDGIVSLYTCLLLSLYKGMPMIIATDWF